MPDIRQLLAGGLVAAAMIAVMPSVAHSQVDVPPVPQGKHYIWDKAGILSADTESKIGEIQRTAALSHNTQLVVVTIHKKSMYNGGSLSIQEFAEQWFNEWGIGIRRGGKLYNRGILLLVSVGDRKARIELGAEWGRRWDAYCQRVMDETIIPQFKAGDYGLGVMRGVDALGQMATKGPDAKPPQKGAVDSMIDSAKEWTRATSFFSFETQMGMSAIGLLLIVISLFIEDEKRSRWCFWIGVGIIVLAVLTYIIVGLVALLTGGGDNTTTGGFSGGGGFGGGFSGGGGATGSW